MVHIYTAVPDTMLCGAAFPHDGFASTVAAGNAGGGQDGVADAGDGGSPLGLAVAVGEVVGIAIGLFRPTIALGHTIGLVIIGITVAAGATQLPIADLFQ